MARSLLLLAIYEIDTFELYNKEYSESRSANLREAESSLRHVLKKISAEEEIEYLYT